MIYSSLRALARSAGFTLALACVPTVNAQSFTWNNFTGASTSWSTAGNWLGGVAPSFNGTETLTFSGTPPLLPPGSAFQPGSTYAVTVNGATNYGVNQMVFNNFGSPTTTSFTTTAGVTITSDTAGGTISFQGSNPAITQSGAGAVNFAQGTATTAITLTASGLTINGAGLGDLQLLGTIGGAGNLTINQTGAGPFGSGATVFLTPTSGNTFVGSTTLVAGNLSLGGANPFGPASNVVNINGGLLTSSAGSTTIANPLNLNGQLTANARFAFSGPISGNGGMLINGGTFVQFTNVVSGTGTIAVNDPGSGTLLDLLNGGTALNASGYSLTNGSLLLSNTAANATRLNPAATFAMNGSASFEIDANSSANTAEHLASLTLTGQGVITLSPTPTSATSLTFGTLARSNKGTLKIVAQVASTSLGGTPGTGVASLLFTTSLSGDNINGVLPYVTAAVGTGSASFNSFTRYDNANGVVPLNLSTDYDLRNPAVVGNAPTANLRLPATANTFGGLNSPTAVNALLVEAPNAAFGGAWYGTGTLTLTSGALLTSLTGSFPSQPSFVGTVFQPNIALGTATGYFATEANTVLLGNITGAGGLVKSAAASQAASAGTMMLAGNNSGLTGGLLIHGGSVFFSADNQLGAAGSAVTIDGGTGASLLFNPDNQFAPGTASAVTINRPITLGAAGGTLGTTLPATTLTVGQPIGGAGALSIGSVTTAGGVVRLTAANTYAGGTFVRTDATLAVNGDAALGAPAGNVVLGVETTFQTDASFTTARNFVINSTTVGATFLTAGNNLTINGVVSSVGIASSFGLEKVGLGTLTLTAANSVTGGVFVGDNTPTRRAGSPYVQPGGSLVLSGPAGSLAKATEVVIYPGGQFVLDNSGPIGNINNNRLGLSQSGFIGPTLQLANSGEFQLIGNANGNVVERVGPMGLANGTGGVGGAAGGGIFTLQQPSSAGGQNTNLIATSQNNPLGAGIMTSFYRGTNLGVTTAGTDYTTLKFITPPTLSGGAMAYAVYANSPTATPQDFAAYDATNGVVRFTNYVALPASGGSAGTIHVLTGPQTLTGDVNTSALKINGGTLNVGAGNLIFGNAAGQILSVGALNADTITNSGSALLDFSTHFGSANIIVNNSLDIGTAANPVRVAAAGIYKLGRGELRLSDAKININGTGSSLLTVIAQGGVKLLAANALLATSQVALAPGTTFDLNSFGTVAAPVPLYDITGLGTVKLGAGALGVGANTGGPFTFGGGLDGTAGSTFIKTGTSTLFFNGNSPTFAGGVRVLNGILTIDADVTPGNAGSTGPLGAGTTPVQLGDTSGTSPATLGLGNQLTQFGRDIVVPAGVPNTTLISLTINAGGQAATGGVMTVSGNITLGRELRLDWARSGNGYGAGATTLSGNITDGGGTGSIDLHGGNWNFWGNNSYSGRTYFEDGAISYIVGVGTDSAFGAGPIIIANQASFVTFRADNGPRAIGNTFTFEGGASGTTANFVSFLGVNDLTFTSPTVDLAAAPRELDVNSTGTTTFTGNLVNGDPTNAVTKYGAGTLVLSGASTFSGAFAMNEGVLGLGSNSTGAITSGPIGTGTLNLNGGTLRAVGGARTVNNAIVVGGNFAIDGSNDLTLGGPINLGATVQQVIVTNTGRTTFSGVLSGTGGGLSKAGPGTLNLTGANSYTGGTTVTGGTLLVNNASGSSGTGTGPVIVTGTGTAGSGGTLAGAGFISGNVTISSATAGTQGGAIAPGNSPGTLTITGSSVMTWNPVGTYVFEHDVSAIGTAPIGGNNDLVKGVGTSSLNLANLGTAAGQRFNLFLQPVGSASPTLPVTYTIIDFTASTNGTPIITPIGFTGNNLTPYFSFTGSFQIAPPPILTLVNGNQIQATFTPVPEPEFILASASGLVALVGGLKYRRRRVTLQYRRNDYVQSGASPR